MRDYKAFTVQHMFIQAEKLFNLTPQDIVFPQPGQEEQWEKFADWCQEGILGHCKYPLGEFIVLFGNQMAKLMLGQILACEPTLDPKAFDFPDDTVKDILEPILCPKCHSPFDPHSYAPGEGLLCMMCGFSAMRSDPESYKEIEEESISEPVPNADTLHSKGT